MTLPVSQNVLKRNERNTMKLQTTIAMLVATLGARTASLPYSASGAPDGSSLATKIGIRGKAEVRDTGHHAPHDHWRLVQFAS